MMLSNVILEGELLASVSATLLQLSRNDSVTITHQCWVTVIGYHSNLT